MKSLEVWKDVRARESTLYAKGGHPQTICCACKGQDEDSFTNLPYHPVAEGVCRHVRKGLCDHVTKKKHDSYSVPFIMGNVT
jgi:hypothetical protein